MKKKNFINKIRKKQVDKKCYFCGIQEYCVLDVHRIIPGAEGGEYTEFNTVTCCSCCHRKIHKDLIKIDKKYYSTKGWILHYFDEKGLEHFS